MEMDKVRNPIFSHGSG